MNLLPQIKEMRIIDSFFTVDELIPVYINNNNSDNIHVASLLACKLEKITFKKHPVIISGECSTKSIIIDCNLTDDKSESYCLKCTPDTITITANSMKGIFYGTQTLLQIFILYPDTVPCFIINDSPNFSHRGYYHDITRGKVPTITTLKKLVEKLAYYKINELQLYIEHSFAFRNIPELWLDKDPITHEEILELDQHCKKYYIDLIPSLATFGHLYELLRLKRFEHLNELDLKASELPHDLWDRMAHYTIDPLNEESLQLITSMLEEFMPLFSSRYFNICCDETFDLGRGKNEKVAQEKGVGRLYVDFLKKIINVVVKNGKIPMFWGDIVLHHPELINEIPSNAIFLNWAYGVDVTEEATETFHKYGVHQYVCPGVMGWSRFANDIQAASVNIRKMIQYGKKYSSEGVLNTDWGDCGHVNFISGSYHGMILGASLSWNIDSYSSDSEFDNTVSVLEWKDKSGRIAGKLRELGSLCFYHFGNLYAWVNNKDCLWNKEDALKNTSIDILFENYKKAGNILNEIIALQSNSMCIDPLDFQEMIWSASAIRWTLGILIFKKTHEYGQGKAILTEKEKLLFQGGHLIQEFKKLWRKRNKESELYNVVKTFKNILENLTKL